MIKDPKPNEITGTFGHALQTRDLKLDEKTEFKLIEAAFWNVLETRGKRCLWIVDDLPSGLRLGDLGETWYARWAGASTLVTTRNKESGALGSVLDLGVLSTEEAFGLLRSHRQPAGSAEESAARQIVELLGCHPLAVEVAASYLAQGLDSFDSYNKSVANPLEDEVEFGALMKESLPTGHERSISTTLLKSIRQLETEGLDFLQLASVLAVAPIQVKFVSEVFERLNGRSNAKNRSLRAVNQVETLSLCERFGDDAQTVHTLVSRTMRFQFPDEERTATLRSAAVQALNKRLASISHIGEHSRIAMDIPHARHLVANELQTEHEATLAFWLARRDYERADYESARKLQEQVLATSRRVLGEEHPGTLAAMNSLAQTLHKQGDLPGAANLQGQTLATSRRVLGDEHPGTLAAMNSLSQTMHAQGDLAGAANLQERALAASRRVLGDEHPATLTAMNNLAQMLRGQGDLAQERKLEEQVLAERCRVLGDEHPDTLTVMNNLAQTLHEQGDLAGARKLEDQVLAASLRVLGEEHPDTLRAMHNLAGTLYGQGDLAGARKLQEQALGARRRVQGEEHPDTLKGMHSLAQTLHEQGDLAGSAKLQEQALAISRRVLGEEHPGTLAATNSGGVKIDQ